MNKEEALKPTYNPKTGSYVCGNCKRRLPGTHKDSTIYCPRCGWKIGWNMVTEVKKEDILEKMTMTFYIKPDLSLGWR